MHRHSSIALAGLIGLVVGFVGGYSVPQAQLKPAPNDGVPRAVAASKPVPAGPMPTVIPVRQDAKPSGSERAKMAGDLAHSAAGAFSFTREGMEAREKLLREMKPAEFPLLIEGLCADAGPDGMTPERKNFLESVLKKWWEKDRDAVIRWLTGFPPGPTKRFLATQVLADLLLPADPQKVQSLARAFKAEDPGWDYTKFNDSVLDYSIQQAWKNPQVTAEQMLGLYAQVSKGSSTSIHNVSVYPADFDFRKFMDGILDLQGDDNQLSLMPGDTLEEWAKTDPQAAAAWFVGLTSPESGRRNLPHFFVEWDKIADAVSAASGTEAYQQWAAGVFQGASDNFLRKIAWNAKEADVIGIVKATQDSAARDRILGAVAGGSNITSAVRYLGLMSSPQARLEAIRRNRWQFSRQIEQFNVDTSVFQELGLTKEQVDSALAERN